jgi:hypothetical protein
MTDQIFEAAYARARSRYANDGWSALTPRQITEAIYMAMRQIDAERVLARGTDAPPPSMNAAAD